MRLLILLARTVPLLCLSAAPAPQIGFDGVAPVRVGMTRIEAERVLRAKLSFVFPQGDGPIGCAQARARVGVGVVSYMMEKGRIVRADVDRKTAKNPFRTAAGIGLGSSIDQIRSAYGRHARSRPNAYDDANPDFEVKSADGKSAIVFETERGLVVRIRAGRLPAAEYIEGCA